VTAVPTVEQRLQRIEDRQAIEDLAVRYGLAVDDHDLAGLSALFAEHGSLRQESGVSKGQGVAAVAAYFEERFRVLGPTNHFVHGHVVDFEGDNRATGVVASHAEVFKDGAPMLTAMRYYDTYCKVEGRWVFEERVQSYMYFVDVRDYAGVLGSALRVRSGDGYKPADWPRTS